MWWAVDLLASEYGGGPQAILDNVSLYELICLVEKINIRRVADLKMQATIATYPNFKPEEKKRFLKMLDRSIATKKDRMMTNRLDTTGMEALKFAMSQNPRIVVK